MNPQSEARLEQLVDILLGALADKAPEIKTLVGHRFPDDDVWLCCWMAKKFISKAAGAEIVFVNAGTALPGSENNPSIIHFDTGGGDFDQHVQEWRRTSSAAIFAEKLGVAEDPGLTALIEMVTAVDNVEFLPVTSIHYSIEGYPRKFRDPATRNTDWQKVHRRVFELFDIVYGQETQRAQSRENLQKHAVWTELPNGLRIATLLWRPELRDTAFEEGADVVVWTVTRWIDKETGESYSSSEYNNLRRKAEKTPEFSQQDWEKRWERVFHSGVQRSRRLHNKLSLRGVAMHLRDAEAHLRQIQVRRGDLGYLRREGPVSNWFLHQSLGLVLCGSRTWEVTAEEYTKILPRDLLGFVVRPLSAIPREQVDKWLRESQRAA